MTMQNPERVVTKQDLKDFYDGIYPYLGGGGGESIQVLTMPEASQANVGKIVEYVGDTTASYTNGYFYVCVGDGQDPETFSWEQKNVQPGGSTSKAITSVVEVGGIEVGTTYPVNTPIENIIADMLEPTLYPTFIAPSASFDLSINTYYAVGATIPSQGTTISYDAGAIMLNGVKQAARAGGNNGFALSSSGADSDYSYTSESAHFIPEAVTRSTKGTIVITATVNYLAGLQPKDSKGNDYGSPLPAGSTSTTKTATFIQPYYYGVSNTSAVADFTGLTASVTPKGQKTFNYTTNNQYMVFAYDSSYGNLKTILDGNGFDVTGGWTKNTVTVGGFSYYVYVANSPTTDTNAPFTFKY